MISAPERRLAKRKGPRPYSSRAAGSPQRLRRVWPGLWPPTRGPSNRGNHRASAEAIDRSRIRARVTLRRVAPGCAMKRLQHRRTSMASSHRLVPRIGRARRADHRDRMQLRGAAPAPTRTRRRRTHCAAARSHVRRANGARRVERILVRALARDQRGAARLERLRLAAERVVRARHDDERRRRTRRSTRCARRCSSAAPRSRDIDAGYKSLIALLTSLDPTMTMQIANSIWYRNTFPFNQLSRRRRDVLRRDRRPRTTSPTYPASLSADQRLGRTRRRTARSRRSSSRSTPTT